MAFFRAIILGVGESLLAIPYLYHDETLLRLKYLIINRKLSYLTLFGILLLIKIIENQSYVLIYFEYDSK
jgi:hypothetical protein